MRKCIKRLKNLFIVEKPNFSRIEKFKFSISRYCYVVPTACAESKSMAEFCYHSRDADGKDVNKADFYLVTYGYQFFFLWFRLHVRFEHTHWTKGVLYQKFDYKDKSKTIIEDLIKS